MSLPSDDKARKALPIFKWLTTYFPDAIIELVKVSVKGNMQHNPERAPEDIKWARGKSMNQLDTAFRHMWDHALSTPIDTDECYHLAKAAWRNLAELQLTIERHRAEAFVPAGTCDCATLTPPAICDTCTPNRPPRGLDGHG